MLNMTSKVNESIILKEDSTEKILIVPGISGII